MAPLNAPSDVCRVELLVIVSPGVYGLTPEMVTLFSAGRVTVSVVTTPGAGITGIPEIVPLGAGRPEVEVLVV